jgi:hypothetical protein
MQSKREIIEGARRHRVELEAYTQTAVVCAGDGALVTLAEELRQQSLMMCDAIVEYFAAEQVLFLARLQEVADLARRGAVRIEIVVDDAARSVAVDVVGDLPEAAGPTIACPVCEEQVGYTPSIFITSHANPSGRECAGGGCLG